jgi:hypothetical protein
VFVLRLFAPWLAILVLAVANGALRELLLVPMLGYPWALLLSGLLLCVCVALITWFSIGRLRIRSAPQALGVGALWLGLTLTFEFGFGRLVQGKSWNELFGAYAFERGNLWSVVLLVILLCPAVMLRLQSARPSREAL